MENWSWETAVKWLGLPGALLLANLALLLKGRFRLEREVLKLESDRAADKLAHDADIVERDKRYVELRVEKDMWRDLALQIVRQGERTADGLHKVADKLLPSQ